MTRLFAILLLLSIPGSATLTREQKILDFTILAQTYAANYGPYHWKLEAVKFDLMDLKPWLAKVEATKNDIEFMEVLNDYTSSLDDAHVSIGFPSTFRASLGFTVDLFEGKPLIDSISRATLPVARFGAQIGDELISIDGKPAATAIAELRKYYPAANPRSTNRWAANLLTLRPQSIIPSAGLLGDTAEVEIRRANGDLEKFTLNWVKSGFPLTDLGTVPVARGVKPGPKAIVEDDAIEPHMRPVAGLLNVKLPRDPQTVLNQGGPAPIFGLPTGFRLRLAGGFNEFFVSGTYVAEGKTIGFIRIPSYAPPSAAAMTQLFDREIAFFEENTDGLVIDDMRNPGGSVAFCEALLQRLIPTPFRTMGFEIRATSSWVQRFGQTLDLLRQLGAVQWQISNFENIYKDLAQANKEGGRTGPLSLNGTGSLILLPAATVYRKPLIVLTDEMSASGGDFFPAVIQDNGRGKIVGWRTMGAGGNVVAYDVTISSEASATVTQSLMVRSAPVVTAEYPAAPYVENIGVRPDVEIDYMTRDNLLNRGTTFVAAFTKVILERIAAGN